MAKPITKLKSNEAGLVLLEVAKAHNTRHLRLPITLIGRGRHCDLCLNSTSVSLSHAVVSTDGEAFVLSDLGSRTGVRVNDQMILEIALEHGMDIEIGRYHLRFETIAGQQPTFWGPRRFDEPASGVLTDLLSEQEFELVRAVTCIGQREGTDIRIEDASVSRAHAILVRTRAGIVFKDLASRNGTLINDEPTSQCLLETGDEITIGHFSFYFQERDSRGERPPSLEAPQPRTAPAEPSDESLPGTVTRIGDIGVDSTITDHPTSTQ